MSPPFRIPARVAWSRAAGSAGDQPPAPVVAPPPGHPRFALLDSLRAIAAVSVMIGHVGFLAGVQQAHWYGALMAGLVTGVPIFFALSGFLLYRPSSARRSATALAPACGTSPAAGCCGSCPPTGWR